MVAHVGAFFSPHHSLRVGNPFSCRSGFGPWSCSSAIHGGVSTWFRSKSWSNGQESRRWPKTGPTMSTRLLFSSDNNHFRSQNLSDLGRAGAGGGVTAEWTGRSMLAAMSTGCRPSTTGVYTLLYPKPNSRSGPAARGRSLTFQCSG